MSSYNVSKEVDKDLAASSKYLDLKVQGGLSGSTYPKQVAGILLCENSSDPTSDVAEVNVKLQGNNNRVALTLRVGEVHPLPVERIYKDHTTVNGLIVFGRE